MSLWHPFDRVPEQARWPLLALLLAFSFWLGTKAGADGYLYNSQIAPDGIVSLEMAGNADEAQRIIRFWDLWGARDDARGSVVYDYVFLIFYSATIALACVMAAPLMGRGRRWHKRLGYALAWAQWLAALFDAVENVALLKMLSLAGFGNTWPAVARWCAIPKFLLIFSGIAYVLVTTLVWHAFWSKSRLGLALFAHPRPPRAKSRDAP
jgi:hypothetical protein